MSVDYYSCNYCGETFCDCGDYVSCDCGKHWCSDECAEEDGFVYESCKLGKDIYDNDCKQNCYSCDNKIESSCKYCREEDFSDYQLLNFTLKELLKIKRSDLIQKYKKSQDNEI